jgi:hypothetical protein
MARVLSVDFQAPQLLGVAGLDHRHDTYGRTAAVASCLGGAQAGGGVRVVVDARGALVEAAPRSDNR